MEVKMSTKKVIALLISLLLVIGLFVGCAKDGTDDTSPTPIASEPAETETETGSTDEPAEEPGITFPLDEPIAFRIWNGPMSVTAGMNSPNDSFAYKEAEKRTNVHIEWDQPASGSENEQFNLIVTSGDLPDSFMSGYYIGGLDKYINEEVIIDLMPYLEDYGKNFLAIANITEDTWKRNVTDMGRMPGFYNLSKEIEPTWMGPQVREDWLKEMGLQSPVTYDDWYEMLTRARDEKGVPKGYGLASADGLDDALLAGFNMINGFYAKDGQVKFGPYEPELLDYLTMLNEWYDEGLIDPDFGTYAGWAYTSEAPTKMLNNEYMAFRGFWTTIDLHGYQAAEENPNFQLVAVPAPMHAAGDTRKLTMYSIPDSRVGTNVNTITVSCGNVPVLVSWYDYFYSDEGEILADYGVEDLSFKFGDDGKPAFTEIVTNNPDGLSQNDALFLYTIGSFHSRQYDWARQITPTMSTYGRTAGAIWDSNWDQNAGYQSMLGVTLNDDEAAEYSRLFTDIQTYVTEAAVQFINGSRPLSEFDSYLERLKSMEIERCIELYQVAYGRYMNR
jgi:putative aldouronate transport system substrate-binding protein